MHVHSTLVKRFLLNRESKKIRLRLRAERVAARVNDDDDGGGGDTTVIVLSQVTKEEMVNESWLVMVGDGGDTIARYAGWSSRSFFF